MRLALAASSSSVGRKARPDGVVPGVGQRRSRPPRAAPTRKRCGTWTKMPAPSPVYDLGSRGAAVGQPLEHGQALVHDVVVGPALEVRHHADAAGVVFV